MRYPDAIVLTRLTRRSNESRRVVIQGFDIGYRTFKIALLSVPLGVVTGLLVNVFIGSLNIFGFSLGFYLSATAGLLVIGLVYLVISSKTRAGTSYFKSLSDWRREHKRLGRMHLGVDPIDKTEEPEIVIMQRGAIPNEERIKGDLRGEVLSVFSQ